MPVPPAPRSTMHRREQAQPHQTARSHALHLRFALHRNGLERVPHLPRLDGTTRLAASLHRVIATEVPPPVRSAPVRIPKSLATASEDRVTLLQLKENIAERFIASRVAAETIYTIICRMVARSASLGGAMKPLKQECCARWPCTALMRSFLAARTLRRSNRKFRRHPKLTGRRFRCAVLWSAGLTGAAGDILGPRQHCGPITNFHTVSSDRRTKD